MAVIDLTARRFERLEKGQQETNETLGRVAEILEAHSRHFERMEEALIGMSQGLDEGFSRVSQRMDRLTTAIARGRTHDLARLDEHDRRIHGLEKSRRSRKRGPDSAPGQRKR